MTMRKVGGTLSRELLRTGIAVVAVAAVVLIYQGCSQPTEPAAESPSAPGAVNAQEEASMPAEQPAEQAAEQPAETEKPMQVAQATEMAEKAMPEMPTKAIAVITPTEGNECNGTVTFTQVDGGTKVEAHIMGLTPGKHGFHIHEFGDISSPDGKSTGGHFNPMGVAHGGPHAMPHHMGDMGNLEADENGHAMYSDTLEGMQVHYIVGRAITIHAGEDDLTSQPTGNAGGRVGVGVIGIAKTM